MTQPAIAKTRVVRCGNGEARGEHPPFTGMREKALEFGVCNTGAAVPLDVERLLLRGPVRSATGLGIGLYQAARQAEAGGYALALERNRDGEVCFLLSGPVRQASENPQSAVLDEAAGLV